MAITLDQFVETLTASGLFSAEDLADFQRSIPPEKRPKDAEGLARELVRHRKLTKYQAAAVYQGKSEGMVFGEYTVLDRIGAGAMGEVFKARHQTMERFVALKVLPAKAVTSPDAVERFHREVQAAARLTHPNIVTAYDAGEQNGTHYLVTEYIDGRDLGDIVKNDGPLPVNRAADVIVQAARGLAYAHAEGITHRDIKPGNLLIDHKGTVKVLDMGLARVETAMGETEAAADDGPTSTGQIMGTFDYMSPEQAMDTRQADARSDVYSLGCTLYRLLTGKVPYAADTVQKKFLAHREAPIPSLREANEDVPERLDAIFRRMMAKQPEDRHQTMSELIADLETYDKRDKPPVKSASGPPDAKPAPAKTGSATPDQDLAAFFRDFRHGGATKKKKAPPVVDETIDGRLEEETGHDADQRASRPGAATDRRNTLILAGIGVAVIAAVLLAVIGLLFALLGRGGKQPQKHPEKQPKGHAEIGSPANAGLTGIEKYSSNCSNRRAISKNGTAGNSSGSNVKAAEVVRLSPTYAMAVTKTKTDGQTYKTPSLTR